MKFHWETEFKETEIGKIPKDWKIKIFRDLCEIVQYGYTQSASSEPVGPKFLRITDIVGKDSIEWEKVPYCKIDEKQKRKYLLKHGEIVIARTGAYVGTSMIIENPPEAVFASYLIRIRLDKNKVSPKFVHYLLKSGYFINYIRSAHGGSAQPHANAKVLTSIELPYPPPEEQTHIATVLSWFDELIENKRKQNEILEKIAMAIFKSWFIDFEPFQDEEFVYNEELDMEIPKGWDVKPIGEIADFTNGLSYKGSEKFDKYEEGAYVFITLNNVEREGGFKLEYAWIKSDRLKKRHFLRDGELIMANTDMTQDAKVIGSPALVVFPPDYAKDVGVYSHHITRVRPIKEFYKLYLYLTLKSTQKENVTFSTGTNVLGLDIENFKQNKYILTPPQPILQRFHSLVEPIFQKITLNQKQILILKRIRDTLLPQLVFGRLRVEEI